MLVVAVAIPLTAVAAAAPTGSLLAISSAATLVHVDAATLRELPGPTVALPSKAGGGFLSPDRSLYVVGSNGEPTLTFFDVRRMQRAGTLTSGQTGSAYPIAWPEQDRLFVEGWACCPTHLEIVVVDPVARAVLTRIPLVGGGFMTASTANGVAVLLDAEKGIKPARVVTIDRDGGSRSVVVTRIKAGTAWRGKGFDRRANIRQPGFAVDRSSGIAYVVDASRLVAQIDLRTLDISYHSVATRRLARTSKQISGPMLFATWIGDGHVVVSGTNAKLRKTASGWRQTWGPAGVALLDTRTWASQMLDAGARSFAASADGLFIVRTGLLSVYKLDGTLRYTVAVPAGDAFVQVFGNYAYVWGAERVAIVDVRSGTVLATLPKPSLYLIAAEP